MNKGLILSGAFALGLASFVYILFSDLPFIVIPQKMYAGLDVFVLLSIPGFVLAIEPMITRGSARTKVLADDWTVVSADKSRGSHFEHTYAILPDGKPFVLTSFDGGKAELARLGVEVSELL